MRMRIPTARWANAIARAPTTVLISPRLVVIGAVDNIDATTLVIPPPAGDATLQHSYESDTQGNRESAMQRGLHCRFSLL